MQKTREKKSWQAKETALSINKSTIIRHFLRREKQDYEENNTDYNNNNAEEEMDLDN